MTNHSFQIHPAYAMTPGVTVCADSVTFSAVFRNCDECGLILYHLPDLEKTVVPFPASCRSGSLYSMTLSDFRTEEWCYRYFRDGHSFTDPFARGMVTLDTAEGPVQVCRFFAGAEDRLPEKEIKKAIPWQDKVLYCLHVKGFTADQAAFAVLQPPEKARSAVFGYGGTSVVIIKHGSYLSVYCDLASVSVSRGQKVSARQTIGRVGSDGLMQFQLRRGTVKLNPEGWLAR